MRKTTQKGFAHLGLILLLLVVAAVAFGSYRVVKNRSNTATNPTTAAVKEIPVIKNTADLNTVETTLNNQNIDGNLNPDNLNDDVQSLL